MHTQQDRNAQIVEVIRNGATLAEAGALYGLSGERVRTIALQAGVVSRRGGCRISEADMDRACAMVLQGAPMTEAAKAIGTTWETIRRHLRKRGLYNQTWMPIIVWDDTKDALLRTHYNSYPGAAQMLADLLGTTKNSVIGRAGRIGLRRPK